MKDKALVGASVATAFAANLCCILPIVFVLLGTGVAGAAGFFAAWRPVLLGMTFALLAAGFYFAYRTPQQTCEPGSACEMPTVNRAGRLWLWIATAFVVLFAAFPLYSGAVANFLLSHH